AAPATTTLVPVFLRDWSCAFIRCGVLRRNEQGRDTVAGSRRRQNPTFGNVEDYRTDDVGLVLPQKSGQFADTGFLCRRALVGRAIHPYRATTGFRYRLIGVRHGLFCDLFWRPVVQTAIATI